jgi:hypothetical protein
MVTAHEQFWNPGMRRAWRFHWGPAVVNSA